MTRELRDKLGIFLLQKYLEAIEQKRKAKSIRNQPAPKSQKNAVPNYFCTFFSTYFRSDPLFMVGMAAKNIISYHYEEKTATLTLLYQYLIIGS